MAFKTALRLDELCPAEMTVRRYRSVRTVPSETCRADAEAHIWAGSFSSMAGATLNESMNNLNREGELVSKPTKDQMRQFNTPKGLDFTLGIHNSWPLCIRMFGNIIVMY